MTASPLSPRALEMLRMAAEMDEEIVCDGLVCYVDCERFSRHSLDPLLRCLAVSDVSDVKGLQRYVVNEIGRQILENPALAAEVFKAVIAGKPFQVVEGKIEPLADQNFKLPMR